MDLGLLSDEDDLESHLEVKRESANRLKVLIVLPPVTILLKKEGIRD